MAKFSDAINHAECFSFCGEVVLFGCGESLASVIDRTIPIRRCFNTFAFRSGRIAQKWKDKEYSLKFWGLDTLFTKLNDTNITCSQNTVGKPQIFIIS